jgi:hypothetical protein
MRSRRVSTLSPCRNEIRGPANATRKTEKNVIATATKAVDRKEREAQPERSRSRRVESMGVQPI